MKAVKLAETIHLILLRALKIVVIRVRSQVKSAEKIPKRILKRMPWKSEPVVVEYQIGRSAINYLR